MLSLQWHHMSVLSTVYLLSSAHCANLVFSFVRRFVRQCLSLLSASVTQGPEAAREILSHIHINKALSGLAKRRDKRVCGSIYLFFLSFQHVCWVLGICILKFFSVNSSGKT